MATPTVHQCRPVFHQRALRCLVWAVMAGSVWVELFWLPAFGQEQTKPVIKLIATGGTIANTGSGRIPFQQIIADIAKNFPETLELLDSVKFEVIDLLRISSQDFSSQDFLNIVRTVNKVIDEPGIIQAAVDLGVTGIVINGFTNGGIPYRDQLPALEALAKAGMPIVRTARGGMNNRVAVSTQDNFIEGDNLVSHKARILLQLALTKTSDLKEIQRIFDEY